MIENKKTNEEIWREEFLNTDLNEVKRIYGGISSETMYLAARKKAQKEVDELKAQNMRMAHWIFDVVESELSVEEVEDDCAYNDALEILGVKI